MVLKTIKLHMWFKIYNWKWLNKSFLKYIFFAYSNYFYSLKKKKEMLISILPWNIFSFFFENILFTWFCISCVHVANSPSHVTLLSICQQCRNSIYLASVSRTIFRDAMSSFHSFLLLIEFIFIYSYCFALTPPFLFALHLLTNVRKLSSVFINSIFASKKTGFIFTSIMHDIDVASQRRFH